MGIKMVHILQFSPLSVAQRMSVILSGKLHEISRGKIFMVPVPVPMALSHNGVKYRVL